MILLPDITIVSQIYESPNTFVYRGAFKESQQPLILKLLKEDYPTLAELYRYQQEYEITCYLNLEETIKAYELRKYQNTQFILLEDFGGDSLKILLEKRPFSLSEFLHIAIKITDALGKIHQKNIIHKDINPSNIVLNPQTGQLKIIDFGLSSILSKENPTFKSPNVLEGTLAYMSPEQTGRMNQTLDYRTDFYSLGATFYELLTNELPFKSVDALELVHCHIAKQPIPPHRVNSKITKNISEIVMKLMAKTADERYQSAWGIKADLETCLVQYQKAETQTFTLGRQDIENKLQISQKIYGREAEIQSLFSGFERVSQGQTELMLISGYAGIGKSVLVQELYKLITEKRGYFIAGKFDQLNRDTPYQALIAAFQELVRQLLTETESQLQQCQQKILAVLGGNAQIIIDVIPEIELIIGKQQPVPELSPIEAQNRFNLVFQNFIQVFCQKEHPLVLFLDDLQWTDSATLQLLQLIITHINTQYLFLIGAYRDNEVSISHPLMLTLSEMKGVVVNHIYLTPLNIHHVNEFIGDTLKTKNISTQKLAELVWEKTQGNPFFVKELLKSLYTEKLLRFERSTGIWSWDLEQIITRNISDNVVELISGEIKNLSELAQKLLRLAACIGNQFDLETLAIINEKTQNETANELWNVIQTGLILPVGDDYKFLKTDRETNNLKVNYKFAHDRIQQAAYSLIIPEHKQAVHWRIGQLLLQNTPQHLLQQRIFDIVNQLNFGIALITPTYRTLLAQLNLTAGKKAKASGAWKPAWNYFQIGINCMKSDSWVSQYDLTLALFVEAAETASLNGNFEEMNKLILIVLEKANSLLDKVKVYEVKIQSYTVQNNPLLAIETALSVLKMLDIIFPKQPTKLNIVFELIKIKLSFVGKRIEDLIDLPVMTNSYKLAAMRILSSIGPAAHFATPELLPLIILKQVNLSVKYGNASTSSYAYAAYGLILSGENIGDIDTGYRFGKLALLLLDKFNSKEFKAKIILIFNYFIRHWKEHIKETLSPLRDAYLIGLETGDLEYASYSACVYCYYSYVSGKELAIVEQEMATYSHTLSQLNQQTSFYYNQLNRQVILNLLGRSVNNCLLIGESYDETKMLPLHLEANAQNLCRSLYFYKLVLCYLFQDYQQAIENIQLAEQYTESAIGTIPLFHFYDSLIHLAIYTGANPLKQKQILYRVKANQKKLKKWARFAPMTHLHKFYLVEAECYRVLSKNLKAIEYYELTIKLAKENEYINEEALANELAAKFYLGWGKNKIAQIYFYEARYCYEMWGAIAKVKNLEESYPQFFKKSSTANNRINLYSSLPNRSTGKNLEQALDIETLMKAASAITSEIELDKLLSTLMKILIENAGAQTGYLILESNGELKIEASGNVENEQITVLQSMPIENCLPTSIIYYVARTKESIVLDNAVEQTQSFQFKILNDLYIQFNKPKSILCYPVVNQTQLIGVFYLENNLATHVFTSERLETIQLLSTQSAIALSNAKLYTLIANYNQTLELKVDERTLKLAQANTQLESEIASRKIIEVELAKAKELAETANQAKSIFIANMSHELRTPLNAILGFSQLMVKDQNLAEKQQENLNIIHRSGEHLLTLINQVLDLSKIEAGRMTLSESNFNLKSLLANIEDMFRLKAKDKDVHLQFECAADVPQYIRTDEVKLRQVLINFVSNAIKFTDKGSVLVKVRVGNADNKYEFVEAPDETCFIAFEIIDTGVGIAPSEFEQLFQPFVQTTSGQQLQQGTGLGLTISRQFIRLMGGEINVISGTKFFRPGTPVKEISNDKIMSKGTTFKFDIKVGVVKNKVDDQAQNRYILSLAPNQPEYRILVVDDNEHNRQLLVKMLQPLGFVVQETTNGQEAIEIWKSWVPHLIWMDMQMPVMDGYEATRQIKSMNENTNKNTIIIAITASTFVEEKAAVFSAGCDDFLRKPFSEQIVLGMMAKHLGVIYTYQDIEPSSRLSNVPPSELNLPALLAEMPNEWIFELHNAALDADAELVSRLLNKIPTSYVNEIMTLKDWVDKYRFEKILSLFD